MQQKRLFLLLLKPSLFSSVVSIIVAGIFVAVIVWAYIYNNPLLGAYFTDSEDFGAPLGLDAAFLGAYMTDLISQFVTYEVLLILVAALVGMLVYVLLRMTGSFVGGASNLLQDFGDINKEDGRERFSDDFGRLILRIASAAGWLFFCFLMIQVIFPFCVLTASLASQVLTDQWSWIYALVSFLVLLFSFHINVILLRLIFIRPRVFGGKAAIMNAVFNT